jgi:transcriptional repressor NrdR
MSRRHRNTGNDKTTKTRQQRVSKTKTKASKSKQQQQQQELVIKRSSGRKEKFDTNRMAQTVGRSGVPFLMARDVAKTVSNKIKHEAQQQAKGRQSSNKSKPTQLKEKTVTASRIRNLVSNELRDRNRSDIAASYSGQTPENTLPEEDLKDKQPTIADTTAANRNRVLHDQSKRGGGIMT